MRFDILTIFPEAFESYFDQSILKKAQKKGLIRINIWDIRDFTDDPHKSTDDLPYGGGAGMIMKIEPLYKALKKVGRKTKYIPKEEKAIILLSPCKNIFNQQKAVEYSKFKQIVLICGRYEGFDERIKKFIDEEVSAGYFVLSGGELPAMMIVDAVSRLIKGVLGNTSSLDTESYNNAESGGYILEYPQYTRPASFKAGKEEMNVPEILLSGDHEKIREWRKKNTKLIK